MTFDQTHPGFVDFIRESNRIEGILRDPTEDEIAAHERLLKLVQLHLTTVGDFQAVIAPGKPIRERPGMNVRVGNHIVTLRLPRAAQLPAVTGSLLAILQFPFRRAGDRFDMGQRPVFLQSRPSGVERDGWHHWRMVMGPSVLPNVILPVASLLLRHVRHRRTQPCGPPCRTIQV
jgi:hypothetical protein